MPAPFQPRRRFITIASEHTREKVDLEVPANQPVGSFLPDLIKTLGWSPADGGKARHYQLRTESGAILNDTETLVGAAVENWDELYLTLAGEGAESEPAAPSAPGRPVEIDTTVRYSPAAPQDRRGPLAPPRPRLVTKTGAVFVLNKPRIIIGRYDGREWPDVNLLPLEPSEEHPLSSRRHAEIVTDGSGCLLIPGMDAINGTYVNGTEIRANEHYRLKDGDAIQFGWSGVELTFRTPAARK